MKIPPEAFQLMAGLPGEELIVPGLRDLEAGRYRTPEALLVMIARTRLTQAGLGFLSDFQVTLPKSAESLLYQSLSDDDAQTAYGLYNSLKRRLESFIHCLESRSEAPNRRPGAHHQPKAGPPRQDIQP